MHINLKNKKQTQGGFSLIEMLTVIAVFGIISSIVLFNHGKFTSATVLTNVAYEVALSIREAQIYGVSVRNAGTGGTPDFNIAYGINIPAIPAGGLSQYVLFKDNDNNKRFDGTCPTGAECVTTYNVQKNIAITAVNTKVGSTCTSRDSSALNIAFKRPDPTALFSSGTALYPANVTYVQITLTSKDNDVRYIVIANNGQISVQNTSIC